MCWLKYNSGFSIQIGNIKIRISTLFSEMCAEIVDLKYIETFDLFGEMK